MTGTTSLFGRASTAVAAAVASATLLAACGTTPTASSPQHVASTGAGTSGTAATGTALRTIDGSTVLVPSGKPSVLVFISISCGSCSAATKAVAQASRTIGDKVSFLGVDLDPGVPAQDVNDFLGSVNARNLPTMIDAKFALLAKYKVSALSSVIVIDPAGKVTYRAINPTANAIAAAVAQSS